jgi:hypothetical protein
MTLAREGLVASARAIDIGGTTSLAEAFSNAWGRVRTLLGNGIIPAIPGLVLLSLLRISANRACMLEDQGVFAAYWRGIRVLADNLGSALVLLVIQVGISIALGLVLLLPALCCLL